MTVYLVPGVFGAGAQIGDQNLNVAGGALVNTYAAGTTSPVATWTTAAGNVTSANPIVANADGRLPNEIWQAQGQAIKIVLTDSIGNTLGTYDNLYGVNDPSSPGSVSGYFILTSIAGTANAITAVGPSNLSSLSAGQLFVIVPLSNNSGPTTLTITPSGGVAFAAKNVFADGLASAGNELRANVPAILEYDGTQFNVVAMFLHRPNLWTQSNTFSGVSTGAVAVNLTSLSLNYAQTSIAAATTTQIFNGLGNSVLLTGNSQITITSFGTSVQAGSRVHVTSIGSGAHILTQNATSLILPSAGNITVAQGDSWWVEDLGSNNFRVYGYQRADGTSLIVSMPQNYIAGLTCSNNVSTAKLDVLAGVCRDSTNMANITVSSSITAGLIQQSGVWAAGSSTNKLDSGAMVTGTTYHVFAIKNDSTGAGDFLFSTSTVTPAMPSGYTFSRRIWSVKTNVTGNIVTFIQNGDMCQLAAPVLDLSNSPTTGDVTTTLTSLPLGIQYKSILNVAVACNGLALNSRAQVYLSDLNTTAANASSQAAPLAQAFAMNTASNASVAGVAMVQIMTNTSAQIRRNMQNTPNGVVNIVTLGWIDRRGQDGLNS